MVKIGRQTRFLPVKKTQEAKMAFTPTFCFTPKKKKTLKGLWNSLEFLEVRGRGEGNFPQHVLLSGELQRYG